MKYCWLVHNYDLKRYECVKMKGFYVTYIDQGTQKRVAKFNARERKNWFGCENEASNHRSSMIKKGIDYELDTIMRCCEKDKIDDETRKQINTAKNNVDYLKSLL